MQTMSYVIKELRRHIWRTISAIAGYTIAAMFILLVLSVTKMNERDSVGVLRGTGTHFIVYIPSESSCCVSCDSEAGTGGSLFAEGVFTLMLNSDLITNIKKIEGVRDAAPYLLYKLYDEKLKTEISLGGIDTASIATKNNVCSPTNLIAGRYLPGKPDEIVLEQSFAMAHSLSVGDTLSVYGGRLAVAGIINTGIKPGKADLYAPIENVRAILKDKLKCISPGFDMNVVLVEVSDARIQKRVIEQMKREMNFLAISSYNCYEPAAAVMNMVEASSGFMSVLVFFFLVVFATRTQLSSLMERSREIGILKSLGWSDRQLSRQIMLVSLIQSVAGVVIGCITGIFLIILLNNNDVRLFDLVKFHFSFNTIPVLFILSLAGGILAGMIPIIRLHRMSAGELINNYQ